MYQKKRDKRSIQSSEMIYEALKELLNTNDYSKITITDLVNKANIGRTTFYRNFNTIDDVLRMKCSEKFLEFRNYSITYYEQNVDDNKDFLKPFLHYFYHNAEIIEILMQSRRENILKECIITEIEYFLGLTNWTTISTIYEHRNYFIAIRSATAMSVLVEWIKSNQQISPDDLVTIINLQLNQPIHFNFTTLK